MAAVYPGSIKSFTNPTSANFLDDGGVPHATQHSDDNDEINAIETALGVNPYTPSLATPGASPTNLANLLGMLQQQFKNFHGLTNWYTVPSSAFATLTGAEVLTNKTLSSPIISGTIASPNITGNLGGNGVVGTTDIADAAATTRKTKLTNGAVYANGSLSLTTSHQDIPGATVTVSPATPSVIIVNAVFDTDSTLGTNPTNAGDVIQGYLNINGSDQTQTMVLKASGSAGRWTIGQTWAVPISAGATVVKLTAVNTSGARGLIGVTHTGFSYFLISQ